MLLKVKNERGDFLWLNPRHIAIFSEDDAEVGVTVVRLAGDQKSLRIKIEAEELARLVDNATRSRDGC
jgi:hypothetical protein